jgi:hypothetical protein
MKRSHFVVAAVTVAIVAASAWYLMNPQHETCGWIMRDPSRLVGAAIAINDDLHWETASGPAIMMTVSLLCQDGPDQTMAEIAARMRAANDAIKGNISQPSGEIDGAPP